MAAARRKKADGNVMWIVITMALLLLFLFVYFGVWKNLFGKGADEFSNQMDSAKDSDNDKVINLQDKCQNTPSGVPVDEKGCPYQS